LQPFSDDGIYCTCEKAISALKAEPGRKIFYKKF
jgi:hypothetical protein